MWLLFCLTIPPQVPLRSAEYCQESAEQDPSTPNDNPSAQLRIAADELLFLRRCRCGPRSIANRARSRTACFRAKREHLKRLKGPPHESHLALSVLYVPYSVIAVSLAGAAAVSGVLPRGRGGGRHADAALLARVHRLRHAPACQPGAFANHKISSTRHI